MKKKTLLYIGHRYHLKSRSTDFLKKCIESVYDVKYVEAEDDCSFRYDKLDGLVVKNYDVCVILQVMPSIVRLKEKISFEHGVFFPMADYYYGMLPVNMPIWEEYREFKIISFSRRIHAELVNNGFDSTYVQYFPDPVNVSNWGDAHSVFFWQRLTHLNVYTLLEVLKDFPIRHLRLHRAVDPGEHQVLLPISFQRDFGVSYSVWYDTRAEMLRDLDNYAVYFAPRHIEGIGLGYLEAMARGRCVVAPRETTADEYIIHGETGYLYDINNPKDMQSFTPEDVRRVQKNTLAYIKCGYAQWTKVLQDFPSIFESKVTVDMSKARPCRKICRRDSVAYLADPTRFVKSLRSIANSKNIDPQVGYACTKEFKILGIPIARKYVKTGGGREVLRVCGIPVVVSDIVEM